MKIIINNALKLLFIVIILNAICNSYYELHYDEAYYWVYSKNIALSYFDHPPLIAYIIRLFSFLPISEFFVRLPAVLINTSTCIVAYFLAKKIFNRLTGEIVLLLYIASPFIEGSFFLITPDVPLLFFWILTLYCLYIGFFENNKKYLYIAGLCCGFALLSKYIAFLLLPSTLVFLLFSNNHRKLLVKKDVYLSLLIMILIFSPVIIWNYQYNWVSFLFQFHHGVNTSHFKITFDNLFDYLSGQILISNFILFFSLIFFLYKDYKIIFTDEKLKFLFIFFIIPFVVFLYFSFTKHMEANWAIVSYISGYILLARLLIVHNKLNIIKYSLIVIIIVFILFKTMILWFPTILYDKVPNLKQFTGNQILIEKFSKEINNDSIIFACDYGDAAKLSFYYNKINNIYKQIYVLDNEPFSNGYRYFKKNQLNLSSLESKDIVYVCSEVDNKALEIAKKTFKNLTFSKKLVSLNKIGANTLYLYKIY